MTYHDLQEIDRDGALEETYGEALAALEHEGDSRATFFKKLGLAGGAALSGGAILSALVPGSAFAAGTAPPSSFGSGDTGILNFALTLEYLESAFYDAAFANLFHKAPSQTKAFISTTKTDEAAHVAALRTALGSSAVKSPKFNFGAAVKSVATFQQTAFVLENTGVHAYLGQAPNISSSKVLLTAASIVTVEARHSGAIAVIIGKPIAPNGPFDNGLSAAAILAAVTGTHFIVSG